MTDHKKLLSVPDKVDKRADALRANLKRRKEAAKEQNKDTAKKRD